MPRANKAHRQGSSLEAEILGENDNGRSDIYFWEKDFDQIDREYQSDLKQRIIALKGTFEGLFGSEDYELNRRLHELLLPDVIAKHCSKCGGLHSSPSTCTRQPSLSVQFFQYFEASSALHELHLLIQVEAFRGKLEIKLFGESVDSSLLNFFDNHSCPHFAQSLINQLGPEGQLNIRYDLSESGYIAVVELSSHARKNFEIFSRMKDDIMDLLNNPRPFVKADKAAFVWGGYYCFTPFAMSLSELFELLALLNPGEYSSMDFTLKRNTFFLALLDLLATGNRISLDRPKSSRPIIRATNYAAELFSAYNNSDTGIVVKSTKTLNAAFLRSQLVLLALAMQLCLKLLPENNSSMVRSAELLVGFESCLQNDSIPWLSNRFPKSTRTPNVPLWVYVVEPSEKLLSTQAFHKMGDVTFNILLAYMALTDSIITYDKFTFVSRAKPLPSTSNTASKTSGSNSDGRLNLKSIYNQCGSANIQQANDNISSSSSSSSSMSISGNSQNNCNVSTFAEAQSSDSKPHLQKKAKRSVAATKANPSSTIEPEVSETTPIEPAAIIEPSESAVVVAARSLDERLKAFADSLELKLMNLK